MLVAGPARSGKSTTVAAMVNVVNEETATHIVTVEDPIEYVYRQKKCVISQREINEDTRSFADALHHILRQSPGVIAVDGMADKESVKMVLEAAETSHLVFCTVRAWNAVQSINKLLDYFSEGEKKRARVQIAYSLKGVISQRLVRRKDGHGFVCACEVMPIHDTMRNIIRDDQLNQVFLLMEDLRKEGMATLNDRLLSLFKKGVIDLEEIAEHVPGKQGLIDTFLLQ